MRRRLTPAELLHFLQDNRRRMCYTRKKEGGISCCISAAIYPPPRALPAMGRQALELGADTFQFFTRNPRGSRAKDLDTADAAVLADLLRERALCAHYRPRALYAEPLRRAGVQPGPLPGTPWRTTSAAWSICRDNIIISTPEVMWDKVWKEVSPILQRG